MECVGLIFLIFAGALVWLIVVAARAQWRADRWNQAFTGAARRFSGDLTYGGWFSHPQLRLRHGESHARVTTYTLEGRHGPRCLELIVQFPDARCHCEILPKTPVWPLLRETPGLSAIEFDWEDFRHRWHVRADDGDEARILLSNGVRWQIDQLWETPERSDLAISIRPGWLLIRKRWSSQRGVDIEQFVELGLALYDQAQLTRSVGIEFIEEGAVKAIDHAQCRVCGDEMERDVVYCRRCKTPHHRDCWEYTGCCSTYGCRETMFLVPRSASAGDAGVVPDSASPFAKTAKPR